MNIQERRKQWELKGWGKWLEEMLGDVVKIEIWGSTDIRRSRFGDYPLCREATGEIILEDLLPNDETLVDRVHNRLQEPRNKHFMAYPVDWYSYHHPRTPSSTLAPDA